MKVGRHGNGWLGFLFDTFSVETRPWPFATMCFNSCNSMCACFDFLMPR